MHPQIYFLRNSTTTGEVLVIPLGKFKQSNCQNSQLFKRSGLESGCRALMVERNDSIIGNDGDAECLSHEWSSLRVFFSQMWCATPNMLDS